MSSLALRHVCLYPPCNFSGLLSCAFLAFLANLTGADRARGCRTGGREGAGWHSRVAVGDECEDDAVRYKPVTHQGSHP